MCFAASRLDAVMLQMSCWEIKGPIGWKALMICEQFESEWLI